MSNDDRQKIIEEHNRLRRKVYPPAKNMREMVSNVVCIQDTPEGKKHSVEYFDSALCKLILDIIALLF